MNLQVYVKYDDDQALPAEKLARASLTIKVAVTSKNGQMRVLPDIYVPPQGEYRSRYGEDDFDRWMEQQAEEAEYHRFRTSGVHRFQVNVFAFTLNGTTPNLYMTVFSAKRWQCLDNHSVLQG